MKKFIYSSLILGSAFALASCSADEPGAAKGDGTTTLTVQLPGDLATRYGEGTSVTTLYYSVFPAGTVADADGNLPAPLISGSQEWPAGQTTTSVELTLVPGDDYDVVFFADNSAAEESGAYTYNVASGNLSIDYTKIASNSDAYDAFFNKVEGLNTTFTDVIELNRPFAQLNIGTNDYNLGVVENHLKNGFYSSTLDFKTTGLASGVNFMTNTYTAATAPFTVSIDELSTKTFGFPAGEENEYAYLEMNYLLVDPATDAPTLVEATYTVTAGTTEVNKLDLTNLPLRANYQTNVYGALLTTKSTFNVEIKPGFALPAYNATKWDGNATEPQYNEATATYTVNQPSDLAGIAKMVNDGEDLTGKTVKLNGNFDFSGHDWTPIGTSETAAFNGEFDGQGYTLSGLNASLMAFATDANIHDVTIDADRAPYTALVQKTYGNTKIDNVTVTGIVNGSDDKNKLGASGIVSRAMGTSLTVSNSTNRAEIIDTEYCAGGIVGSSQADASVTITNCENRGTVTSNRASGGKAGGIMGMPSHKVTISGCNNYAAITTNTSGIGCASGILGYCAKGFTIENCNNYADIEVNITNPTGYGAAGGIYGMDTITSGTKSISDCENTGNIVVRCTSFTATPTYVNSLCAGGILGATTYSNLVLNGCSNSGSVTCISPEGSGQMQYMSGLCGQLGWQDAVTVTDCTVASSVVLSGNSAPFLSAYYTYVATLTSETVTGNTNNTSYAETTLGER